MGVLNIVQKISDTIYHEYDFNDRNIYELKHESTITSTAYLKTVGYV